MGRCLDAKYLTNCSNEFISNVGLILFSHYESWMACKCDILPFKSNCIVILNTVISLCSHSQIHIYRHLKTFDVLLLLLCHATSSSLGTETWTTAVVLEMTYDLFTHCCRDAVSWGFWNEMVLLLLLRLVGDRTSSFCIEWSANWAIAGSWRQRKFYQAERRKTLHSLNKKKVWYISCQITKSESFVFNAVNAVYSCVIKLSTMKWLETVILDNFKNSEIMFQNVFVLVRSFLTRINQ